MEYKNVDYGDDKRPADRRFNGAPKTFRVKPRKGFRVSKVWELHEEISRRLVLGEKATKVAEDLGCTPATVSNVRNSPIIQDRMAIMKGARDAKTVDIARDIQEFAPKALELLKDIVLGKGLGANASASLRAKEANGFLDRAGFAPVRREQHMHAHLSSEDIDAIKQRAFGSTGRSGPTDNNVVEGEVVETQSRPHEI
jgi:hypothetical protein